jgi:hypothetical protein
MGWFDGKGVCFQSKGQGIKPHEWCCVWSTMVVDQIFLYQIFIIGA